MRARIQSAEPLDKAAAKLQKGLRVFVRDDKPLDAVSKRLEPTPAGRPAVSTARSVSWCCSAPAPRSRCRLPGRYKVSPQIAGAIKAVPGVVEVQAV